MTDMEVLKERRAKLRSKCEHLRSRPALGRLRHDLQRTVSAAPDAAAPLWFQPSPPRDNPDELAEQVRACATQTV
jgi:hypothetical protein